MDDEIHEHLKRDFPEFDPAKTVDEDEMKSKTGKEQWRKFMMVYEKKIDDYNFGTLVRTNPKFEYGEKETIFGRSSRCVNVLRRAELCRSQCQGCNSTPLKLRGSFNRLEAE